VSQIVVLTASDVEQVVVHIVVLTASDVEQVVVQISLVVVDVKVVVV